MPEPMPGRPACIPCGARGRTGWMPRPGGFVPGSGASAVRPAFAGASGRFHVGHRSAEPGVRRVSYTETEFCLILSGRVRLAAADGSAARFGPGDALVIEAGFDGLWETLEPAAKLYAIHEAAGAAEPPPAAPVGEDTTGEAP